MMTKYTVLIVSISERASSRLEIISLNDLDWDYVIFTLFTENFVM